MTETRTEYKHFFSHDEEVPDGWRVGNKAFVADPSAPGGVRHDFFMYNPEVLYEDRRDDGSDARWVKGIVRARRHEITTEEVTEDGSVRQIVETIISPMSMENFIEATGLFAEYLPARLEYLRELG